MQHYTALPVEDGFLAFEEAELADLNTAKVVIQQSPYEHTSSYLAGSDKGPEAIIKASHYVEFYDEELDQETYKKVGGICTLAPMNFMGLRNKEAVDYIEEQTAGLLEMDKFVVSLGAEHTVTAGYVAAFKQKYPEICLLQIDAHSDLRLAYKENPYSHASVMARVHDMQVPMVQVGIRAQCKEEAELRKSSELINTIYAHHMWDGDGWIDDVINALGETIYITIDTDGLDPSIAPAVGTAEPGGLSWQQICKLMRRVAEKKKVVGFDIVELAPRSGDILTEFTMAKLCYKILGYLNVNNQI